MSNIKQYNASWLAGYQAGIKGRRVLTIPVGLDALAFRSGYIRGKADLVKKSFRAASQHHALDASADGE